MKNFLSTVALVVALVVALSGTAHAQDFGKAAAAYNAGDYATAVQELRPLAEQGNATAQFNLGLMYRKGQGVPQDYKEALEWYRKAAEQGDAGAQFILGLMYDTGQGVPQDYKEAVEWYRKAAEQGNATAQFSLGSMYQKGQGVLQDNVIAHMWYNMASANGEDLGGKNRDIIAKQMTSEDISKAQAMARECIGSNYQKCGY